MSTPSCTGFTSSGNCSSDAKTFATIPAGRVIRPIPSSALRKSSVPVLLTPPWYCGSARLLSTATGAGTFASSGSTDSPRAAAQITASRFAVITSSCSSSCWSTSRFV